MSGLDIEHVRELRRLVELLAKHSRPSQRFSYCRCGIAPCPHQRDDERTPQIQLSLLTLDAFRQISEMVQALVELRLGLDRL